VPTPERVELEQESVLGGAGHHEAVVE